MVNITVTYYNFIPANNTEKSKKILSRLSELQEAGKTDGEVMRYNSGDNGENFVIEREFVDLESAEEFKTFIMTLYTPEEQLVEIAEITP